MTDIKVQVFLVDTGSLYHVDASLNSPVSCLKESIWKQTRIPVECQVLLLSGGAALFPESRLCQYSSVSDNYIYLVCRDPVKDIKSPPSGSRHYSENELRNSVDVALKMPPARETVEARMSLVQQICDIDVLELKEIENMVYDQHLQQQGWASVVANFHEVNHSFFEKRAVQFMTELTAFLKCREDIVTLLGRMPEVMTLLGKIPILRCLEEEASRITCSQRGVLDKDPPFPPGQLTLYHWMNLQGSKHRLEEVINDVTVGTDQLNPELQRTVEVDLRRVEEECGDKQRFWPITGLEERLSGLDKLTRNAKSMVDTQENTKHGFQQNRQRLEMERDASILPDLCATHKKQLADLYSRHLKLRDLKSKCAVAKKELSKVIKDRLPIMMGVHQLINMTSNNLWMKHSLLKRIDKRARFLLEVERAPNVYASMVMEVIRRRSFATQYVQWSTGVATESKQVQRKESKRRRAFTKQIGAHFLQKLFVGFKDQIPKFASEAPKNVDSDLPEVTPQDIDLLAREVPELQQVLRLDTLSPTLPAGSTLQGTPGSSVGDVSVMDPFLIDSTQTMATSSSPSFIAASHSTTTSSTLSHQPSSPFCSPPGPLLGPGERERLSLSYQGERPRRGVEGGEGSGGAASEGSDAAAKGDNPLFLSLQDQFSVPQCLSATLTAEVNSAATSTISVNTMSASPHSQDFMSAVEDTNQHHHQQPPQQPPQPQPQQSASQSASQPPQEGAAGGDGGCLLSSGDMEPATKSSDSDVSDTKPLRRRKQPQRASGSGGGSSVKGLLSDTSPDAETSQEFATADFYFEDSMPSSMTDSPPKTGTEGGVGGGVGSVGGVKVITAQHKSQGGEANAEALAQKAKRVDELEGELSLLQSRLLGSREKLSSLGSSMSGQVSQLRHSLGSLRSSVQQDALQWREQLLRDQDRLQRALTALHRALDTEREEAVTREREGGKQTAQDLENKYREKCQAMKDLEQSMVQVTQCIADLNRELQQQRESSHRQVTALTQQYEQEHKELKQQHEQEVQELKQHTLLEVELEVDKVRADMQTQLDTQDTALTQLQEDLQQTQQQLTQAEAEQEKARTTLQQQYEEEMQQLQATLEAERAERAQAVEQARQAAQKETSTMLQRESQDSQTSLRQQMEQQAREHEAREKQLQQQLEEKAREHDAREKQLQQQLEEKAREHEAREQQLQQQMEQQAKDHEVRKEQLQQLMEEKGAEHEAREKQLTQQMEDKATEHEAREKQLTQQMEEKATEHEAREQQLKQQLEEQAKTQRAQLLEQRKRHRTQLEEQARVHEATMSEHLKAHGMTMAFELGLKAEGHKAVMSEKERQHQAQLEALGHQWEETLAAREKELSAQFDLKLETVQAASAAAAPAPEVREWAAQSEPVTVNEQSVQSEGVSVGEGITQTEGLSLGKEQGTQSEELSSGQDCGVQCGDMVSEVSEDSAAQTQTGPQCQAAEQEQQPSTKMCDPHTQSQEPCQSDRHTQCDFAVSTVGCSDKGVQADDTPALAEDAEVGEQSSGDDMLTSQHHQQMLDDLRDQLTAQFEQIIAQEKEASEQRAEELERQHRQLMEDALRDCRSAVLAERQIKFNEAISSAVKGKDTEIEMLKGRLEELNGRLGDVDGGDQENVRKQLADIKEKESQLQRENRQLESEVHLLQQQLHQYSEQIHTMTASASPLSLTADPATQSSNEGAMTRSTITVTDEEAKDQKIMELEKKLMESSMTTSIRRDVRDKVSILTCNVGDLVLLCLDERHDQYVVFTVGTTLHFLHSECIDPLGLRPGEGEARKNWVLAEVTEREYCQARKAQNRFRVPVNTKFYRVKAKPWVPKSSSSSGN